MAVAPSAYLVPETIEIKRALLSVSDKTGIAGFAAQLAALGVELVSTGGTKRTLTDAGLSVRDVAELTGFPEIMDGRVKTLHPGVHGGLLAVRQDPDHRSAMDKNTIVDIDLLVVDLYPFEAVLASHADDATMVENIDIGGPAMIRAGAKNHAYVTVITDPGDYGLILDTMTRSGGHVGFELRRRLAAKAFARVAAYDSTIANWFAENGGERLPQHRTLGGSKSLEMRYGENPHQNAALYRTSDTREGVCTAKLVQGKALSYNNINDTDAAYECVAELGSDRPAVAIIKHANPCGVAQAETQLDAYHLARRCDPVSAFGGIIALNQPLNGATADAILELFTEVIIAPGADEEALARLSTKPNVRLLLTQALPDPKTRGLNVRTVAGGLLVQDRDNASVDDMDVTVVTKRQPSAQERADLMFAFKVAKHVKSNAIVYVKDGATVGIGAGQMSRVDSSRIAALKAADAAEAAGLSQSLAIGSVVASDAFFPFADGLLAAADAGATAVIQPGGSMRDADVIKAADEAGLAMMFTRVRHFRH